MKVNLLRNISNKSYLIFLFGILLSKLIFKVIPDQTVLNVHIFLVEASLAACSSGPCQNNGTCFDAASESHRKHLSHMDDYECFCARGFTGKNCEGKLLLCKRFYW